MATKVKLPASIKLAYHSNSANIAFYRDDANDVFVEVLRGGGFNGKPTTFYFKLNRWNAGGQGYRQIGAFDYTPKTKPAPGNLPLRTVNRIVNAWLKENAS